MIESNSKEPRFYGIMVMNEVGNYKVRVDFFKALTPVQQNGRRIPIMLHDKIDKEIENLLSQGHIKSLKSVRINISYPL